MAQPRTLSQKVWDAHLVRREEGQPDLLYIDLHLVHEVTSPQAFDGLRLSGRRVRRPDLTVCTEDHNVPTEATDQPIADPVSRKQVETLRANAAEFDLVNFPMRDPGQGIVHVIGPEQGRTLPGMTIVCGDSHTSTHGAFGALAFGIGTSEVEHVLATQTLPQRPARTLAVNVDGALPSGSTAKDVILAILGRIGTSGGIGHVAEYRGSTIRGLSMEGRMTVCNMSIEAGAKAGLIAPDDTTFAYLQGRAHAPTGQAWDDAVAYWRTLATDDDASFDKEVTLDAGKIRPYVSWGTNPGQVTSIDERVPDPATIEDPVERSAAERALVYMGLDAGTPIRDIAVDTVFIGSCTNSRIEDLRLAADVARGRRVASGVRTLVVPGSWAVKHQAEAEGLDVVLREAGFDSRDPGCSMCLAMNPDKLSPGERCASTSNRNFEGRQGRGGRTHLVSPAVAAATAIAGHFTTPGSFGDALLPPLHREASLMEPVRIVQGTAVPLDRSDVDTDQIIPSDWLKRVERTGFEKGLFGEWRDDPAFVLNKEEYAGASILVAGPNFGTGSSREHAVWAIQQYGFRAVVSPRFGDIFANNASKNGLVAVVVTPELGARLMREIEVDPDLELVVDVDRRVLEVPALAIVEPFPLDDAVRQRFLEGLDDIGLTLRHGTDIADFESLRPAWLPTSR